MVVWRGRGDGFAGCVIAWGAGHLVSPALTVRLELGGGRKREGMRRLIMGRESLPGEWVCWQLKSWVLSDRCVLILRAVQIFSKCF